MLPYAPPSALAEESGRVLLPGRPMWPRLVYGTFGAVLFATGAKVFLEIALAEPGFRTIGWGAATAAGVLGLWCGFIAILALAHLSEIARDGAKPIEIGIAQDHLFVADPEMHPDRRPSVPLPDVVRIRVTRPRRGFLLRRTFSVEIQQRSGTISIPLESWDGRARDLAIRQLRSSFPHVPTEA